MKLKTKFQDEDFELGEVVDATISTTSLVDTHIKLKAKAKRGGEHTFAFSRISELFELFEDYEEPKGIRSTSASYGDKSITIEFSTREETVEAYEKLTAWKRLKDKGFKFNGITKTSLDMDCIQFEIGNDFYKEQSTINSALNKDLDICFGGEE